MSSLTGRIKLKNGYTFDWSRWNCKADGEIVGAIHKPEGGAVPNTSGWWSTHNPHTAAALAGVRLGEILADKGKG